MELPIEKKNLVSELASMFLIESNGYKDYPLCVPGIGLYKVKNACQQIQTRMPVNTNAN